MVRAEKRERELLTPALFVNLREPVLEPALQFCFVRMGDLIHELFQFVPGNVVPHRVYKPPFVFSCGDRAGDSPRFTGGERGSPPGQGGAPEAEASR